MLARGLDRLDQKLGALRFPDEALHPSVKQPRNDLVAHAGAVDDKLHVWRGRLDLARDAQGVAIGQVEIEHHHVRTMPGSLLDCFAGVAGHGANLQLGIATDEGLRAMPQQRMVVGQEDAKLLHVSSAARRYTSHRKVLRNLAAEVREYYRPYVRRASVRGESTKARTPIDDALPAPFCPLRGVIGEKMFAFKDEPTSNLR